MHRLITREIGFAEDRCLTIERFIPPAGGRFDSDCVVGTQFEVFPGVKSILNFTPSGERTPGFILPEDGRGTVFIRPRCLDFGVAGQSQRLVLLATCPRGLFPSSPVAAILPEADEEMPERNLMRGGPDSYKTMDHFQHLTFTNPCVHAV